MMRVLIACKNGNFAERDAQRHCLCAECKAEAYARRCAWRKRNPDRVKAYSAKWNAANQEQRRLIEKCWKLRNPESVAEHNRKAGKKWAANNKPRRLASVRARQLAKRLRTPAWADKGKILSFYEEAARLTGETGVPHEVDHIVPLQGALVSGLHVHQNLRVVSRSENRSKQNRWEA